MKKFKAKYGEIPNVSDRDYFTNSQGRVMASVLFCRKQMMLQCHKVCLEENYEKGVSFGNMLVDWNDK